MNKPVANLKWVFTIPNIVLIALSAGGSQVPCDTNCDGSVNAFDIQPFIYLLADSEQPCALGAGDANGDGSINAFDVTPFIECLNGWSYNPANGHYYRLSGPGTWGETEAEAQLVGAHLVTVNDLAENDWLQRMFGDDNRWIGLHQLAGSPEPDAGWVWSSGEESCFTNWCAGEPNDDQDGEAYAEIKWTGSYCAARWNDQGSSHVLRGIIERGQSGWIYNPSNGHYYRLSRPGTWQEAQQEAEWHCGNLVTINDAVEQEWLTANFPWVDPGGMPRWVGLYQDTLDRSYSEPAGAWKWVSGQPLSHLNWHPSEPNDGLIHGPGYENHAAMHHFEPGLWNDYNGTVNIMQGIIERE